MFDDFRGELGACEVVGETCSTEVVCAFLRFVDFLDDVCRVGQLGGVGNLSSLGDVRS